MGYLHIDNLYKPEAQRILEFKRVYALEKVHGTSAHIAWKNGQLRFYSGGCPHDHFVGIFDSPAITATFTEKCGQSEDGVVIYGEAYGGKVMGMSHTYGSSLRFIAFDVKIGDSWLAVPQAEGFVKDLGIAFVPYAYVSTDLAALDYERDRPSTVGEMLGNHDKIREGIVLRPPFEVTLNNGARLIAKHKRAEFMETSSKRPDLLDPAKIEALAAAERIVEEWVTENRLDHVIDHVRARLQMEPGIELTGDIVRDMVEDVRREGGEEIVWSKDLGKAIGAKTVKMFKARLERRLRDGQQ